MKNNTINFSFDLNNYPMEAVYSAAYVFIDQAYLFFESAGKNKVKVSLKGKKELGQKKLEELKGEFLNELLNSSLRIKLAKSNKKIREYIIGQALLSAVGASGYQESEESEEEISYQDDPLGIAIPWEEKYKKKK